MKEHVLVVLGIPREEDSPMPATVTEWPTTRRSRKASFQYLSPEQLAAMGPDQTAIWEAEYIDGRYWLSKRLPNKAPPDPLRRARPLVLDETEIPF